MKRFPIGQMTIDQLLDLYVEIGVAQDDAVFHDARAKFRRLYGKKREVEIELATRGWRRAVH